MALHANTFTQTALVLRQVGYNATGSLNPADGMPGDTACGPAVLPQSKLSCLVWRPTSSEKVEPRCRGHPSRANRWGATHPQRGAAPGCPSLCCPCDTPPVQAKKHLDSNRPRALPHHACIREKIVFKLHPAATCEHTAGGTWLKLVRETATGFKAPSVSTRRLPS